MFQVSLEPHFYEVWYWRSQIALFFVILATAIFGACQLYMLAKQSRASFLLDLDKRFDGPEMTECRRYLKELREEITTKVNSQIPNLTDSAKVEKIGAFACDRLKEIRTADPVKYQTIMRFVGFFETVGLTVKNKYVSIDDIDKLLRGPIIDIDKYFRLFIEDTQKEMGVQGGLYEHALFLTDEVKRRASHR